MKVIDLLNKIANGEEIPEKIRIDNSILINEYNTLYKDKEGDYLVDYLCNNLSNLNEEIEIIEDTPKEAKKIAKIGKLNQVSNNKQHLNNYILRNKINEIIDRLNGEDNGKDME